MGITAAQVKELRDATNVSMMECKNALQECDGDMDKAVKLLRERGMAVAAKRASKTANQGIVTAIANPDGSVIGMVEVNCETDFAARNESFKEFVDQVATEAISTDEPLSEIMNDVLMDKVARIGENLKIRRNIRFAKDGPGKVASYIHLGGKVGVLIEVGCQKAQTEQHPEFDELVKDLTLHIAAASPQYLTSDEVPADVIEAERKIYEKQVEGKPANIVDKIVDGKMNKFFSEVCLVDQPFVKEPKQSITQLLEAVGKQVDDQIVIKRFIRYQLGA